MACNGRLWQLLCVYVQEKQTNRGLKKKKRKGKRKEREKKKKREKLNEKEEEKTQNQVLLGVIH